MTSEITIGPSKNIIIDFDGKTINTSKSLINHGTLTFKDGSANQSGMYINARSGTDSNRNNIICNYGDLNIQGGTIKTADSGISYSVVVYNSGGTVNMTGGNVYAGHSSGDYLRCFYNLNGGILNISGGYIRGASATNGRWHQLIYNAGFSVVNITGGKLYAGSRTSACIYGDGNRDDRDENIRAKIYIRDAEITFAGYDSAGSNGAIILNGYDSLELENVKIVSNGCGIRDVDSNSNKDRHKKIIDCDIRTSYTGMILRLGTNQIIDTKIDAPTCLSLTNVTSLLLTDSRICNSSNTGIGITANNSIFTIDNTEFTNSVDGIIGSTGIKLENSSILQVNNMTLNKFTTGVWILSNATLRLGTQGGEISTTIPSITGNSCGIKNESGRFYFYDGVVKSKGTTIAGNITGTEPDYVVDSADDEEGYHNITLVSNASGGELVYALLTQSGSTRNCYSLQEAIAACNTGGEIITLVRSTDLGNAVITIDYEQNLTINLNGQTIRSAASANAAITNHGILQIKDNSNSSGKIESTLGAAIVNDGTVIIGVDDGSINSSGTSRGPGIIGSQYGIDNQGTLNFYDGYIKGNVAINGNRVGHCPENYIVATSSDSPELVTLQPMTMGISYTVEGATIHISASRVTHMYILVGPPYELVEATGGTIEYDYTVAENGNYYFAICDINENYTTIKIYVDSVPTVEPPTNTIGNDTNTVGDDTNTVGDDTNTVGDDTNTVGDDTNTVGDDTNTVGDDTNTTGSP